MTVPFDSIRLKDYPDLPGVYAMKNKSKTVIYVGKAKSLRSRLRQYFNKGGDGRAIIPFLVAEIYEIDFTVVSSEKEALLLENTLIKRYKPRYNALLKDDRSFVALKLTTEHPWPRLELVRSKGKPKGKGLYFGPYPHAFAARQTLEILHKIFPLRQCSDQELLRRVRPCILYDMKRCIAPCVNLCTHEQYDVHCEGVIKFLRGQSTEIVKTIKEAMEAAAEELEFEKAQALLITLRQIETTLEKQRAFKLLGGDMDALGIFRQGDEVVLSQVKVREGRLQGSFNHSFAHIADEDAEVFNHFILQHYPSESDRPDEILMPYELETKQALEEIISIKLAVPQRGDKKSLVEMAEVNAKMAFQKEKDVQNLREKALLELQEKLHLTQFPRIIDCFDNSNLSGSEPVAACVSFKEGKKETSRYRKFNIKEASGSDDYGMMFEVLSRRYKKAKEENDLPDLIIVDGGKGQLNVAVKVLERLDIAAVDVIGLAKEEGRHDRGVTQEQIFIKNIKDPILLKPHSSALHLLQRIRDEAHRSAIGFQKKKRSKTLIKSLLDDIAGIGPQKKKALLTHFGSLKKVMEASYEELIAVKGIAESHARAIIEFFNKT